MHILKGLLDDRSIDEIVQGIPSGRVKKNADKIREAIENNLDSSQISLIESSLDLMSHVQDKIDWIDEDLKRKISTKQSDLKIAMSIPVTGGLKVLNFGGIKMPTSTAFGFETKGCVDAEIGGLSHVERTAQSGNEHQRDRQRDRV